MFAVKSQRYLSPLIPREPNYIYYSTATELLDLVQKLDTYKLMNIFKFVLFSIVIIIMLKTVVKIRLHIWS
jgi:hypothetical protein